MKLSSLSKVIFISAYLWIKQWVLSINGFLILASVTNSLILSVIFGALLQILSHSLYDVPLFSKK